MKRTNKSIWNILASCLVVVSVFGALFTVRIPAQAKTITVAFSGFSMTNEYWLALERAAEAEAKAKGATFVNLTTETQDAGAQKQAVDTAITQKVDAIIIGAVDARGWDDTLTKAKAAGIPVIAADTAIDNPYISSVVATDNLGAAGLGGDYICKLTGGKGLGLVIGGSVGHPNGDARKKGVEDKLKACGMTTIGDWDNWDEAKAAEITQNTLSANPDLRAIFVAHDGGALAALSVVKQKGLLGKVVVLGFDAQPATLKAIKAGEMDGTVRQDPVLIGTSTLDLALKVVNGEKVDKAIGIPGTVIDKDNVDQYLNPPAAATMAATMAATK